MEAVTVVEIIKAAPGKKAELRQALKQLIPLAKKNKGCLQYDLLEPLDEKEEFLVLMRWESIQDLRNHEESAYIAEFVKQYDKVLYSHVDQTEWKTS